MELVEQAEFARRAARLQRLGRISGRTAKGFVHDLVALWNGGVEGADLRWRGDDDCSFTVRGRFSGASSDALQRLVAALGRDGVYDGETFACMRQGRDRLGLVILTSDQTLGFVTVCIDLVSTSEPA